MCGRYKLQNPDWVEADFSTSFPTLDVAVRRPRYNIAPGQMVLAITRTPTGGRATEAMHWGIEANWEGGPPQLINARGEKIAASRFWQPMLEDGRCVIPADGFYEWRAPEGRGRKQPFLYTRGGGEAFAFAGLFVPGRQTPDGPVSSCAIVTTEPNELVEDVHDRMPAMLRPEDVDDWLTGDGQAALAAIRPFPSVEMTALPIGAAIGSSDNEGPELIEPAAGEAGGSAGEATLF